MDASHAKLPRGHRGEQIDEWQAARVIYLIKKLLAVGFFGGERGRSGERAESALDSIALIAADSVSHDETAPKKTQGQSLLVLLGHKRTNYPVDVGGAQ